VVDLLHQEIELVSDAEKKSRLLLRAAQIYEDPLGEIYKAAECLQEAVRLNPEGGKGLRALRELQGRFGGDVDREGETTDPVPALLAEARKLRDSAPERALAITLNVLDQDPLNSEALEGLVRYHSERGEHHRAAVWLSMLAGSLRGEDDEGTEEKPSVFLRLGRLIEDQLEDPGRAVEAYFRAWELAPGLSDVEEAVLRLAPEAGRWEEYVKVRASSARHAPSEEKATLYLELATIEEEDLGNIRRAAEWVRAAVKQAPRDDTVLSTAVRLFEQMGETKDLARALAGRFEAASIQGTATAEEAARVARLHLEALHDPEKACFWFARAVDLDATDPALLEESRRASLQAGRSREADRLFLLEIDATSDPTAVASLHRERARLLARELGDEGEALRSLREAARKTQGDFTILSEMETLARRSGRWLDLAKILGEMARYSGVEEEMADLFAQAGDLYWERLSDFHAARQSYAEALKRKPDISKARERMEGGD
jgi:tetratricopeptide (TPR) repeat protein